MEGAGLSAPLVLLASRMTHSAPLRVILSLPAVSQTLSLSNGSLSNPSKRRVDPMKHFEGRREGFHHKATKTQRRTCPNRSFPWIVLCVSVPSWFNGLGTEVGVSL